MLSFTWQNFLYQTFTSTGWYSPSTVVFAGPTNNYNWELIIKIVHIIGWGEYMCILKYLQYITWTCRASSHNAYHIWLIRMALLLLGMKILWSNVACHSTCMLVRWCWWWYVSFIAAGECNRLWAECWKVEGRTGNELHCWQN